MFGLFIILHLAGIVGFVVFLVKVIKEKKIGINTSQSKRYMLISLAVWFAAFILMIVTSSPSDKRDESAYTTEATSIAGNPSTGFDSLKDTKATMEPRFTDVPTVDGLETLRVELKEKYDVSEPGIFVRGDNTEKWRIVKVANATAPKKYALNYAKAYMQDADSANIHFIVNFSLKTTTKLQIVIGRLIVTTTEYVDKEEHDANKIGRGLFLSQECYDMATEKLIVVEANPDAGTVDANTLIMAVNAALEGAIAPDEELKSVSFDGSNLTLSVEILGNTSDYAKKLVAESSLASLTNPILDLDDKYYNTWDTITLDFGKVGTMILEKSMVKDQGLGRYFKVPDGILK